jgi:tetratricopeptide (TPR) repeat protein
VSVIEQLAEAEALVRAGRTGQAVAVLRQLVAEAPDLAAAHELLGSALQNAGDRAGAEAEFRAALTADSSRSAAAARLAVLLLARRLPAEAVEVLRPLTTDPKADVSLLTTYGAALKALERPEEAVEAYRRASLTAPTDSAARYNLASALGNARRFAESEAEVRAAMAMGLQAPEAWLVLGRALIGEMRFDDAEAALRESIARRPGYADAHAELAQLIWMRTEDLDAAGRELDRALADSPFDVGLGLARAKLLEYGRDPKTAYGSLADLLAMRTSDVTVQVAAALLALQFDPEVALSHAERAFELDPDNGPSAVALAQANLALGRAGPAARIAEDLGRAWPLDQLPVTLAATAWRMMNDPRYADLYDYDRLVRTYVIDTPAGWPSLEAFLADLAVSLRSLQRLKAHPIGQSLRLGAQTGQFLALSEDPAIRAFFTALDAPIRAYIDVLAERDDVLGRRVSDGYRFAGAWSVLLRPGGHHVDHIHPMGWISSAFHVELPEAVANGHQGWLKFGEPGLPTSPVLGPERFVRPRAGQLVLFPSYMWHGTVPFAGDEARLTAAFDIVPA